MSLTRKPAGYRLAPRLLTALVGLPLLLGAIWLGFPYLAILVAIAALAGLREFYRLGPPLPVPIVPVLGAAWTLLFVVGGELTQRRYDYSLHVLLGAGILLSLPWLVASRRRDRSTAAWAYAVGGPVYVGFLLAHALALRQLDGGGDHGRDWLLFVLLVTFATDTGAFFTGRAVGRHRMAPTVSPGKTWEGAFGGFACAVGVALALEPLLQLAVPLWQAALIGAAAGTLAQAGDLAESRMKRAAGVKDTGSVLPGHGGILDRLDSIVFTVPVVYYLVALVL